MPSFRTRRLLVRLRQRARAALAGACYGACVALCGVYGLANAVPLAVATSAVAVVCWCLARE